jgi:hypothetical protein
MFRIMFLYLLIDCVSPLIYLQEKENDTTDGKRVRESKRFASPPNPSKPSSSSTRNWVFRGRTHTHKIEKEN